MPLVLHPVGIIRDGLPPPGSDKPWPADSCEVESRIDVFPEFADALDGLDGFSHLFVLSHLDRQKEGATGLLRVSPWLHHGGRVPTQDIREVGVFATDSSARPNPIGLTLVKLVRREGDTLIVRGIDLYDGTPVLDLKPYRSDYKAERHVIPTWAAEGDPERQPL